MVKILHISKYYYPYAGGIEDVCYNIVRILDEKQCYQQRVFCFNDTNQTTSESYHNIPVIRVARERVVASQPISSRYKKELKKELDTFAPDIVHFHAPNPLAAYHLLRVLPDNVRLIVHWHSDIVDQSMIYRLIKPIETQMLRRADIILATSPNYIDCSPPLLRFRNKVAVIANMIDPSKFEITSERAVQIEQIKAQYNQKPIVLFVGRHVPYKGLRYLIEASSMIDSDCVVVIGGRGPLTEQLKVDNKSAKVHFVGRIEDDLLAAYYHAADVFVFPSITKNEAFGVALAEAMYCQTSAVTFTIKGSGVNWVNLKNETGLEVENSNSLELAQAIDMLLINNHHRKEMSQNAKRRIEELFMVDVVKEQIYKLYE